jgi:hypothetical protein
MYSKNFVPSANTKLKVAMRVFMDFSHKKMPKEVTKLKENS